MVRRISTPTGLVLAVAGVMALAALSSGAPAARAKEKEGCSVATLRGGYGFLNVGTTVGVGPTDLLGLSDFDGAGRFSVPAVTLSVNGQISRLTGEGTYTVRPNCTGTLTVTGAGHFDLVVVRGGDEVMMIGTDPGTVAAVVLKKQ
jgi:hypothetical protein